MTSSQIAHPHPAGQGKSRRKIRGAIAGGQKPAQNQPKPIRKLTKSEKNRIEKMGRNLKELSFSLRANHTTEGNIIQLGSHRVMMASHTIEQFVDDMLKEMSEGFENVAKIMSSFTETMLRMDMADFDPVDICLVRQVIGELRKTLDQLQA